MPTRRLTDQFVERVKSPAKGRISYFDASFPGLEMRHSEFGHKGFYLLYRMPGDPRLRRVKLGIYPPSNPRALGFSPPRRSTRSMPASIPVPSASATAGPVPKSIRSTP
jgi:hypothetical protein